MTTATEERKADVPARLMMPSHEKPLFRLRRKPGSGKPPPPKDHERIDSGGYYCDECHVAQALYEITTRTGFLYFCGHHFKKRFAEIVSKRFTWRLLQEP